jgi:peptidylprolyl isomerase
MSTTSKKERAIYLFIALLFFCFSAALTIAIVVQAVQSHNNSNPPTPTPSPQQQACTEDTQTEPTLPKPDTYTTDKVSSLKTTDLTVGNGETAKKGDCLVMKYYGTLSNNGKEFDENFSQPKGFEFVLGAGKVIQGWDQGLVGMKVGGVRRLEIPSAMAYGSQSPSSSIPANSDLVFIVKLLRIEKS